MPSRLRSEYGKIHMIPEGVLISGGATSPSPAGSEAWRGQGKLLAYPGKAASVTRDPGWGQGAGHQAPGTEAALVSEASGLG